MSSKGFAQIPALSLLQEPFLLVEREKKFLATNGDLSLSLSLSLQQVCIETSQIYP